MDHKGTLYNLEDINKKVNFKWNSPADNDVEGLFKNNVEKYIKKICEHNIEKAYKVILVCSVESAFVKEEVSSRLNRENRYREYVENLKNRGRRVGR